eukprot:CAMPEP_0118961460 /NCGR_PEP_ID=MMETSP1173-20130426/138_1 /TAXON_ID=1034831 /ORGANISM="Rhizochromulina marina cf, Strain CCMP1243" /LENGTH=249 /DNA_ID=CAMNT_0006909631 /DNA_START=15 /DNA_END=764 /DNA_ORIENTATION=+
MAEPAAEEELSFLSDHDMSDNYDPASYSQAGGGGSSGSSNWNLRNSVGFLHKSRNPTAALFHVLFKALALLVYIFSGMFTSNFIFVCVICILLLAFDFWTVKNVTGRLLVSLRWWNHVKADGSNEWVFESVENMSDVNPNDSRIFWWGMYIPVLIWGGLFVIDFLRLNFQWLVVVVVALAMQIANIIGYTKCSNDAKERMRKLMDQGQAGFGMMQTFSQSSAFQAALSGIFGGGSGSSSGGQAERTVVV